MVSVQIMSNPLGLRQWPLILFALFEAVDVANLEQQWRLLVPAIVDAFEKMIEEALLKRPVLDRKSVV